jgi:hypothetical protein
VNLNLFEFTEEDLKSNRLGLLSAKQRRWIDGMAEGIRRSQRGGFPIILFFLTLGLGIFLGMTFSVEGARRAFLSDPLNLMIVCAIVPIVLGIFGLSVISANRRAERLRSSAVLRAEGRVQLDESHSSKTGSTYYVIVDDSQFAFPEDVAEIFREGESYRIYYCETSMLKLILSWEKIS